MVEPTSPRRFIHDAMAGADEVIAQARRAAEEAPDPLVAPRPEAFEQRAPGEVEFDLLDESDFELTERFVPPGTVREPDRGLERALSWRVSQWQWVPDETEATMTMTRTRRRGETGHCADT